MAASALKNSGLYLRRRAANVVFVVLSLAAALFGLVWLALIPIFLPSIRRWRRAPPVARCIRGAAVAIDHVNPPFSQYSCKSCCNPPCVGHCPDPVATLPAPYGYIIKIPLAPLPSSRRRR